MSATYDSDLYHGVWYSWFEFTFLSLCTHCRYLITHVPSCVICSRFLFRSIRCFFFFFSCCCCFLFIWVVVVVSFLYFSPSISFSCERDRERNEVPYPFHPHHDCWQVLLLVGQTSGNVRPVLKSEREIYRGRERQRGSYQHVSWDRKKIK